MLASLLRSNMHEGVGRIITPRDGTTKSIVLEYRHLCQLLRHYVV